jgi:hypothetical protein
LLGNTKFGQRPITAQSLDQPYAKETRLLPQVMSGRLRGVWS